jgi:hypothetical protein
MDSPWLYGRYSVCVGDNESVSYLLTNVPADVDAFRVVAYWYDRRHDSWINKKLDDIDLTVDVTSGSVTTPRYSFDRYDEKEQVYWDLSGHGQVDIDIHLTGVDVTADDEGCGTDSMKVYIGYYYEDTDRDDWDGPGAEIQEP